MLMVPGLSLYGCNDSKATGGEFASFYYFRVHNCQLSASVDYGLDAKWREFQS